QLTTRMQRVNKQPNTYTYLLKENEEVKGIVGFRLFYYYEADEPAGQITLLVIKRESQNKGYGQQLLKFTEQFMLKKGVKHLTLTSGIKKEREHAHYFYQKHGYIKTGYRFSKML